MKLEIKLKNPDYCDGCPCMNDITINFVDRNGRMWCDYFSVVVGDYSEPIRRPQKCKEENE